MALIRKITESQGSFVLRLPKHLVLALGMSGGDPVDVSINGDKIILAPVAAAKHATDAAYTA